MRDLALLIMLLTMAGLVIRTPWLGVLVLAFLGYLSPQGYAEGLLQDAPLFLIFFVLTVVAYPLRQPDPWGLWLRQRLALLRDWRVPTLLGLWLLTAITSYTALIPAVAWSEWITFSKTMATVALTLLLIDDRRKLDALLLVIALSIGLVALKGGYWALIHGAQDRVYGSPGGHFYDNNHFAVANLMALPLLYYFWATVRVRPARWLLAAVMAFSVLAVLSSWSRGGLLGLAALGLALAVGSQRRPAVLLVAGGVLFAAVALMPTAWLERMQTIATPTQEGSALNRLEFWETGLKLGARSPLVGWGFGSAVPLTERAEWHSAYVQWFAEHGVTGFALWAGLLFGSIGVLAWQACRLRRADRRSDQGALCAALATSLLAYSFSGAFLSVGYWGLLFQLVAAGALTSLWREAARPNVGRQDSLHEGKSAKRREG